MKKSKKLFPIYIAILIFIGILLGIFAFLIWHNYNLENNKTIQAQAGALSINYLPQINKTSLNEIKIGNLSIQYQPNVEKEAKLIEKILQNENFQNNFLKKEDKIYLILDDSINKTDLYAQNKEYKIDNYDLTYISGNYIYLLNNDLKDLFSEPLRLLENINTGINMANWFNMISREDLKTQINNNKKYDLSLIDLQFKQTQENMDYKDNTNICKKINKNYEILNCFLILFQEQKSNLIDKQNLEFIKANYSLKQNNFFKMTNTFPSNYFDFLKELSLKQCETEYDNWEMSLFSPNFEQTHISKYFQRVNNSNLDKIINKLIDLGWENKIKHKSIKDSIFNTKKYKITFTKKGTLIDNELVILVMETKDMNADCIIEGNETNYCDSKAIYKNSDNYINIIISQKNNYLNS